MRWILLILVLSGCGKPIKDFKENSYEMNALHQGVSEEILFDVKMSANFNYLPLEGKISDEKEFWSGDSWRLRKGAINFRWNSPEASGFNLRSPSMREAYTYPSELMLRLSPAEKYDLYMGRYDYPLKREVDYLARSATEDWEGICHGWAGATINHPEPEPKVAINPDGVEIPFGSSDIKALLSYAYARVLIREEDVLGKRCEESSFIEDDKCDNDLSALSFHVVLTNKIGLRGQTIIADIDRYKEVWNHPIVSFKSTVEKMKNAGDFRKATIKTKFTYVDVSEKNSWEKHPAIYSHMTVKYELIMDRAGNIQSGKWLSKERPDFLWTVRRALQFDDYLNGIFTLLK
ncbi:MAG: hypothetical protein ACLGHN_07840 [Bacteriovoracia bacterium]